MKIAIDARAFGWPGLGRYTRSLMAALSQADAGHDYLVLLPKAVRAEFEVFRRQALSSRFSVVSVEGEYYSLKEQTVFWRQAEKVEADLFHFTHFNVPVLFRRPYVVTVHDATRFLFPGQKQQGLWRQLVYEWVFRQALQAARAVIAVSQTTKEELLRLPLSGRNQITVIYEGVDKVFFQKPSQTQLAKVRMLLGTSAPFLLYVGVWMSHKNLPRLLEVFVQSRRKTPDLRLVLIGKPKPGYINMVKLVEQAGASRYVIFPGFVPEELLGALYAEAACVFLPSLYEGFGLPALEAAAVGTAVVTANVAASAEIMQDGALLVNPEYIPGMVRALEQILTDEKLRNDFIARGKAYAKKFSWDQCARETLEVYQQAGVH